LDSDHAWIVHSCYGTGLITYTVQCSPFIGSTYAQLTVQWTQSSSRVIPYSCGTNIFGQPSLGWNVSYQVIG
jgi:hypothetical protein